MLAPVLKGAAFSASDAMFSGAGRWGTGGAWLKRQESRESYQLG